MWGTKDLVCVALRKTGGSHIDMAECVTLALTRCPPVSVMAEPHSKLKNCGKLLVTAQARDNLQCRYAARVIAPVVHNFPYFNRSQVKTALGPLRSCGCDPAAEMW